jgi:hypothetical protein
MSLLLMLAKKQPVFTTCFVCLALYGLSMMFFLNRDENESWVNQEEKRRAEDTIRKE